MQKKLIEKLILFLAAAVFFTGYGSAHAGLVINEIMYDLSGSDSTASKSREWIEIYNDAGSPVSVDASAWRIYDGSANRTINGEVDFQISAGAYVIFAGDRDTFLADNPGFSGTVYDTGITSLNNTGATLKILDADSNAVDTVAYTSGQGGAGDGNTLQKISGAWSGRAPTPGAVNEAVSPPPPAPSGTPSSEVKIEMPKMEKIRTEIVASGMVGVGDQAVFEAFAYGYNGEELHYGKYFWNFGDGSSRESKTSYGEKFPHAYFYPGEYRVTLDYFMNQYSEVPDATDEVTIKIIKPGVGISKVGDDKDFFVELSNDADFDTNISGWYLASGRTAFYLPKNTILKPKQKMMLPPYITKLNISDKETLKLVTASGEIAYDYKVFTAPAPKSKKVVTKAPTENAQMASQPFVPALATAPGESEAIPTASLAAAPILGGGELTSKTSYLPTMAFISFLAISSTALYFIRRKNSAPGDDFELLDE